MDRLFPNGQPPTHEPGSGRNKFTKKEDEKLLKLINNELKGSSKKSNGRKVDGMGSGRIAPSHLINWRAISIAMKTRTPRQCRERYQNYLSPEITNAEWTQEEDKMIKDMFAKYGNKWNKIAKFFNGRTGNAIRNRYQVILRKEAKMLRKGNVPQEEKKGTENSQEPDPFDLIGTTQPQVPQSNMDSMFSTLFQKLFDTETSIFGPKNLEIFEDPLLF